MGILTLILKGQTALSSFSADGCCRLYPPQPMDFRCDARKSILEIAVTKRVQPSAITIHGRGNHGDNKMRKQFDGESVEAVKHIGEILPAVLARYLVDEEDCLVPEVDSTQTQESNELIASC